MPEFDLSTLPNHEFNRYILNARRILVDGQYVVAVTDDGAGSVAISTSKPKPVEAAPKKRGRK